MMIWQIFVIFTLTFLIMLTNLITRNPKKYQEISSLKSAMAESFIYACAGTSIAYFLMKN
jgi:hypothetical protein